MSSDIFKKEILPLKDKLYRLALSLTGNKQDAEDVVQDVLLNIWNKKESWDKIDNWEAYCIRSTRNAALDKLELATNRFPHVVPEDYELQENRADVQSLLEQREQLALLDRLIKSLPEKQQTIFRLREAEEMSYKEIAYVMNVSEEQIKINLFRARQKIKELLDSINGTNRRDT